MGNNIFNLILDNVGLIAPIILISGIFGLIALSFDKEHDKEWKEIGGWRGWFSKKFANHSSISSKKIGIILLSIAIIGLVALTISIYFAPYRLENYTINGS